MRNPLRHGRLNAARPHLTHGKTDKGACQVLGSAAPGIQTRTGLRRIPEQGQEGLGNPAGLPPVFADGALIVARMGWGGESHLLSWRS